MNRKMVIPVTVLTVIMLLTGCSNNAPSNPTASGDKPTEARSEKENEGDNSQGNEEENKNNSGDSQSVIGWDGEWNGGDVSVTIRLADSEVKFNDAEMHNASLDELTVDGNTLTGTYHITLEMYDNPDDENNPEQIWTLTLVKNGDSISYSRSAELTWFRLNDDGSYGNTVVKENAATLTKVNKQ